MPTVTPIFRLSLIAFDTQPWDVAMNANFAAIDGLLARYMSVNNFIGVWANGTTYTATQQVIDPVDSSLWVCSVGNTSSAAPVLFSTDRTNNPSWWTLVNTQANAQTSANASAASATAAATSATNAASSATAAATSATTALSSAASPVNRPITSNPSTTTITVGAGSRIDSTLTTLITTAGITKSTAGAWVVGNNGNGMGTGLTIGNNTTYHVFLAVIGGATDVFFDTSLTAANKPASTTAFVRVASFTTDGSAHINPYVQIDRKFIYAQPLNNYSANPGDNLAHTVTLTVPLGIVVDALVQGAYQGNAGEYAYLSALFQTNVSASANNCSVQIATVSTSVAWIENVVTNTSGQIRIRISNFTSSLVVINTHGYTDLSL
jgi:hypothetical protein